MDDDDDDGDGREKELKCFSGRTIDNELEAAHRGWVSLGWVSDERQNSPRLIFDCEKIRADEMLFRQF